MDDTKVQWHPGFCAAMRLELVEDKEMLEFYEEFTLNKKPLIMDMLVIKNKSGKEMENEIGRLFKGHNVVEYKSPDDELGIDVFYKVYAYACLYKSGGNYENSIKAEDVTITLIRKRKPITLMEYLKTTGFEILQEYPGIYHIRGAGFFDIQIVVTRELNPVNHIWLHSLTTDLDKTSAKMLISRINLLTEKDEKENADAVLHVAMEANASWLQDVKEDKPMDPMLRLAQAFEKMAKEDGMAQGITQGESMLSRLIQILIKENRQEDINRVTSDANVRKEMYKKYGIIDESSK